MTATYTEVKEALGAVLDTIDGLRVYPHLQPQINPPAAVIAPGEGEFLTYRTSNVSHDLDLMITILVQLGTDRSADQKLSDYIADSGDKSIYALIEANQTLNGTVDSTIITKATNWGVRTFAGVEYLAVDFAAEVLL